MGPVHTRLVPLEDVTEREIGAWEELACLAVEPNPFFEPQFVRAAARWLPSDGVALLVAADDDGWRACLPVARSSRWRRFPGPWLAGWRHPYCFLGTPMVDRERCHQALEALVAAIRKSDQMRLFAFEWMGAGGPVEHTLEKINADQRVSALTYETFVRAALHRRPDGAYLSATLSSSRRKELRRLKRRLGEELQEPIEVRDRADDPRAYEDFLRLEASGWKGARGTALGSSQGHAAFFVELCERFHRDGRLQLLTLGTQGKAVAMQCNLLSGNAVFCFKVAYDEQLGRYSPGVQLEVASVEVFHAQTSASVMDSCAAADNDLINRLWPDRRTLTTIVLPGPGLAGHASRRALGAGAALRRRLSPRPADR